MDRKAEERRREDPVRETPRQAGAGGDAGLDARPERRPGVPREAGPAPAEGAGRREAPSRQDVSGPRLRRKGLDELTPVVGTAQPPHGLSGVLRRIAYRIPEHRARHWSLLLAADRLDVAESRVGKALGRPLRGAGFPRVARRVERNPLPSVLGALATGWIVGKVLR